ncbi:hypothetical protein O2N63_10405 [Aliiroseovarius sp. KMU-50]|uniref:Phytanoyl-CoA dioxygenase family protein n=1 Tax=Aliiroseovarius salicola TaxID=3009082 RepID=A0ABT4W1W4_9RHOB|nr:hypothetical protein [Aliiroseovarius sp. KMU-50]MDA5094497.1 hypothetical protein [Aliiroseovarius sp. KMU-50]
MKNWVQKALPFARDAARDPVQTRQWKRCGGTWFVGVNALPNDGEGVLKGGGPLTGAIRTFIEAHYGWYPLDQGQVSITYPGYPKQDPNESDAAHSFRKNRDAAHLDGIKPELPGGQRCVGEAHAYVIGIPLNSSGKGASPLVVWEESHHIMRRVLTAAFDGVSPNELQRHDITDAYRNARREVFETCPRVEVYAQPGEAYLLHRFALHGVAPWAEGAEALEEGRMIAYFRPELPGGVAEWLRLP